MRPEKKEGAEKKGGKEMPIGGGLIEEENRRGSAGVGGVDWVLRGECNHVVLCANIVNIFN